MSEAVLPAPGPADVQPVEHETRDRIITGLVTVVPTISQDKKLERIEPEALNDTDCLELFVFQHDSYNHAVLVARLDNLGKGASGAAVQNIQLMLGLI